MIQSALSQTIFSISQKTLANNSQTSFKRFNYKIAESYEEMELAKNILMAAHQSRNSLTIDFPPAKEEYASKSIIFILEENRRPVGTFSIIIDSANQLPADLTISEELSEFRTPFRFLSEICSLGFTKDCQFKREMMFFAFFLATMQNFALKISDCVVTVKEHHKCFYNGLNFVDLSTKKISARSGATVQLLSVNNQIASQNSGVNQNTFHLQSVNESNGYWKYIHRNIDENYIEKILSNLKDEKFLIETEMLNV